MDSLRKILENPARLAALKRTALLDTPAEETFDRLTRLAAKFLDAPIAIINLISADEQFFKSSTGLAEPLTSGCKMPVDHSFCQHAVASGKTFAVGNAREHPLVCDSPMVIGLNIIAYLGVPLTVDMQCVGVLCIYDNQSRFWSTDQITILEDLATAVVTEIELRITARESKQAHAHVNSILESITDGFVVLDADWRYTYANAAAARINSTSNHASLVGKNHWEMFPVTLGTSVETEFRRAMAERVAVDFEVYYAPWKHWFEIKASPAVAGGLCVFFRDATWRRKSEEELRKFKFLSDHASDAHYLLDGETRIVYGNKAAFERLGYTQDELLRLRVQDIDPFHDKESIKLLFERARQGHVAPFEAIHIRKDGSRFPVEINISLIDLDNETYMSSLVRDISERKHAEEELRQQNELIRESEMRYRVLTEVSAQVIWMTSGDGKLTYVNQHWFDYSGMTLEQTIGNGWVEAIQPEHSERIVKIWEEARHTGIYYEVEIPFRRNFDGQYRWHLACGLPIRNKQGNIESWIGTCLDIHDRKEVENTLRHNATHDALTGCPNRALFLELLKNAIFCAQHREGNLFAVLFLDLDRFKIINDSLGHMLGDRLLVAITKRLSDCLRPGDTLARFGGDEFTVLLEHISSADEAGQIAERIQNELTAPFILDEYEVYSTASIGIIVSDEGVNSAEDMLRNADIAMYRAKALGRAGYVVFGQDMHAYTLKLWELESDLRHALERDELVLHYQPMICLNSGRIMGVEALARWQHPQRGLIEPEEFIPLAEETGLIKVIGERLLRLACNQLKAWHLAGHAKLGVSVNCSAVQLQDTHLIDLVCGVLAEAEIAAHLLTLEITEGSAMKHINDSMAVLSELANLGVQIAIDDFGTGYSSLIYLKRFPITSVKIDRSFVKDMTHDRDDAAISAAIIAMAHSLKLSVVAEGVETAQQLDLLRDYRCDGIQGFLFTKPVSVDDMTQLLQQERVLIKEFMLLGTNV